MLLSRRKDSHKEPQKDLPARKAPTNTFLTSFPWQYKRCASVQHTLTGATINQALRALPLLITPPPPPGRVSILTLIFAYDSPTHQAFIFLYISKGILWLFTVGR